MGKTGFGGARACGRVVRVLGVLAILGLWLVLTPVSDAAGSSLTWTGDGTSPSWSSAKNWEGGEAPSASEPGKLVFPRLTGGECGIAKPADACYLSVDDVAGLTANLLLNNSSDYGIFGFGSEPLTLGAGGLTAEPYASSSEYTRADLDMSIALGASQTWNVSGPNGAGPEELEKNALYLGGELKGAGSALTVKIANGVGFYPEGVVEVGPLTIEGAQVEGSSLANGTVEFLAGSALNSLDGEPVDFLTCTSPEPERSALCIRVTLRLRLAASPRRRGSSKRRA